ncbi:LysR family transcriptional regulator [Vreelandella sp. EE7]
MKVSLHAIKAFESAARLGSFKKAADELAITPTGVSHHVANLEKRLSVRLFHRQNRQVALTAEGQRLSSATTQGLQTIQTVLDELKLDASRIRVDTTSSFAALVLIPLLYDFHQKHAPLEVEVSTGETIGSPISQLAVRLGDARQVGADRIVKEERFGLYAAASVIEKMTCRQASTVFMTRWKNDRLPSPPWAEWLTKTAVPPETFVITYFDQELYGIHQAIAGKGLVFCSQTLVAGYLNTGTLKAVSNHLVDSNLCYYTPVSHRDYSLNIQALIEWLKASIG